MKFFVQGTKQPISELLSIPFNELPYRRPGNSGDNFDTTDLDEFGMFLILSISTHFWHN